MALELREAPRVALDLRRRLRRRCGHALGLLLLSRSAAAREAAREGLPSPERRSRKQGSRGAYQEARDRHLFHAHGAREQNLRAESGHVRAALERPYASWLRTARTMREGRLFAVSRLLLVCAWQKISSFGAGCDDMADPNVRPCLDV